VGTFTDNGKQFDASQDPSHPFLFVLGVGEVIKGWDQGLVGMCEGEKRRLDIPAELAYGHGGAGDDIPPDAALTFHVELIQIQNRRYDRRPVKTLEIGTTRAPARCGVKSQKGDRLAVLYVGTLKSDGLQFDAVRTPDTPFEFLLGAGEVIQGWEQGLEGMCIGEQRRLVIPASMAYGHSGNYGSDPPIPPDADLVFDTALLDIRNKAVPDKPTISKRPNEDEDGQGRWLWRWTVVESLGYILECLLVFF